MNGVEIVGEVLTGRGIVPDGNIMGGVLDAGTTLPAILLTTISSVDREPLRRGPRRRTTDRVQATVKAASYESKRDVLRLLRAACDDVFGDFAGMTEVTIHLDGIGPDFEPGPEGIFEQAQDLIVSFNEAR